VVVVVVMVVGGFGKGPIKEIDISDDSDMSTFSLCLGQSLLGIRHRLLHEEKICVATRQATFCVFEKWMIPEALDSTYRSPSDTRGPVMFAGLRFH
jgi:hypothetical protein